MKPYLLYNLASGEVASMQPVFFYMLAVVGAAAMFVMLPRPKGGLRKTAAVLGVATLGGVLFYTGKHYVGQGVSLGEGSFFYYTFTLISVAAATRVITHPRPVYSALYFVLVVLSSSGMLVMLQAEFMAFAMVIIYGGAILVTYMFVIMLATLPQSADEPETAALYDVTAREPAMAVMMGFLLVAVLTSVIFTGGTIKPGYGDDLAGAEAGMGIAATIPKKFGDKNDEGATDRTERKLIKLTYVMRDAGLIEDNEHVLAVVDHGKGEVEVREGADREKAVGAKGRRVQMTQAVMGEFIGNIDYVGLNLFRGHTLGIELAGIVLLLSMVGAIVIARQDVSVDEERGEIDVDGAGQAKE